ncbi:hypothetical protein ABT189_36115 [Streptomyces sp900105755]|uniref:hypothetical protein n=1 Tax=Streptomyces sp. 900105755 TaxID=3154389 RepID=UPI00332E3ECB
MPLTRVVLTSGRVIGLSRLRLSSTYGGLLEGYPHQALNDRHIKHMVAAATAEYPHTPTHLVPPPREHPDADRADRTARTARVGPFGPVEILPPVTCIGLFDSAPVATDIDPVLHGSALTIVWFQATPQPPSGHDAAQGLREVAWEELAEDYEI